MTLAQMIRDRHLRWKDRCCMLTKRDGVYREVSWGEFYALATRVAEALLARGTAPGECVAIASETRYEWAVADTAILSAGAVSVPIYPTLSRPEIRELLERSRAKILFVSDQEQVDKCAPLLGEVPHLEALVAFDEGGAATAGDERVVALQAFAGSGGGQAAELAARIDAGGDDTLATVLFTSGTTGQPKGVPLTHGNITANIEAALERFRIDTNDLCLAHLPLAHILERMAGYYLMLHAGAAIAYAENIQTVSQDIATVRPTIAVSVPRIFEKIYAGIQGKAAEAPAPVRALTFWALNVARQAGAHQAEGRSLPAVLRVQYALADHLVYAKVRAKVGGRLRFFISGGAPLAPELALFFNAIGVRVYEGYGLTETSPVIAVNYPEHNRVGSVGPLLSNVEVRIAADGEIVVRGPSVFRGYFEDPDATREAFDAEGFFRTGDIGEFDADGYLRITDRKKDLLVTAAGKNVAPQKTENVLKLSKYISEVMLYGDRKKFISALIVPDPDWLKRYAGWKSITYGSLAELVRHPQVLDYYARLVAETQEKAGLASYESVKKFVLLPEAFSADEGEVTPTMKLRRKKVTEHYRAQLEALYEED